MTRYIISDHEGGCSWPHVWVGTRGKEERAEVDRLCRFVFDLDRFRLVQVDVEVDGAIVPAMTSEVDDLFDSLANGNPGLIEHPDLYGLALAEKLPSWCRTD